MARPSPAAARKGRHGSEIDGSPGAPAIVTHGSAVGGPKKIKGPGAGAAPKGKVKGMTGK